MVNIDIQLSEAQESVIYDKSRYLIIEGAAGSGKTIFGCLKTILYALEHPGARIGVFRLTLPALRQTSWLEIRNMLINYEIPYHENKSEGTIELLITDGNNPIMFFKSLDDLRKIRSMNLDFIYLEQAEEVRDIDTFIEMDARIRSEVSQKDYGQFLMVVTPEHQGHWIYENFHRNPLSDSKVVHFHYTSNPFVDEDYIKRAEQLKEIDYDSYLKLTLGKWGKIGNIVYENWDIFSDHEKGFEYYTAGVDFGYTNPSCFLLIGWYDGEPYVLDEVYETNLTNPELITKVTSMLRKYNLNPSKLNKLYADAAEPDRIQEFCDYGYDAVGGIKDVSAKIQAVKRVKVHIHESCKNTIDEIKKYYFQKDKDGNILEKPVKFNDHAMDALGYSIYGNIGILSGDRNDLQYEKAYFI